MHDFLWHMIGMSNYTLPPSELKRVRIEFFQSIEEPETKTYNHITYTGKL